MKRFSIIPAAITLLIGIAAFGIHNSAYAGEYDLDTTTGLSADYTEASAAQVASDKTRTIIGYDHMYGKDDWLTDGWKSPECHNTVNRFSIRYETNKFFPSWDKWFIGGEFQYSMHKADEKPGGSYHMGHDAGFREYSLNLTIKRLMFDDLFYVGWIMGVSYWSDRDHGMHDLGDSHWLGTWGPTVGKDWHIYKAWSIRTEARVTHTSDPFRTNDRGKNYGTFLVVGISYDI